VEKAADGTSNACDWGFRADMMYGTDAQKTQAFGNPGAVNRNQGTWDASLDHGAYGWAIPQLYAEVAMGNLSIKAGHFYTLIGYEVVTAPDNFFYSHAYTMFNSEPFTHTGVLATYEASDSLSVHGGWTLGWDTGFDQAFGGSSFLGGFSQGLGDSATFTYCTCTGNFGFRSAGTDGYSHSCILDVQLCDSVNYVCQSDYVIHEDGSFGTVGVKGEDVGFNQYLFMDLNDSVSAGMRCEWWKSNGFTPGHTSYYGLTGGLNIKAHPNFIIRPEVRHNWTGADVDFAAANAGVNFNQTVFGCDCILTF
jgi:hypothetical protein